jgi:hypothetical protein
MLWDMLFNATIITHSFDFASGSGFALPVEPGEKGKAINKMKAKT